MLYQISLIFGYTVLLSCGLSSCIICCNPTRSWWWWHTQHDLEQNQEYANRSQEREEKMEFDMNRMKKERDEFEHAAKCAEQEKQKVRFLYLHTADKFMKIVICRTRNWITTFPAKYNWHTMDIYLQIVTGYILLFFTFCTHCIRFSNNNNNNNNNNFYYAMT